MFIFLVVLAATSLVASLHSELNAGGCGLFGKLLRDQDVTVVHYFARQDERVMAQVLLRFQHLPNPTEKNI